MIPYHYSKGILQLVHKSETQYVMLGTSVLGNPTQFTHGIMHDLKGKGSVYISMIPDSLSVTSIATYKMDTIFTVDKLNSLNALSVQEQVLKLTYFLYFDNFSIRTKI